MIARRLQGLVLAASVVAVAAGCGAKENAPDPIAQAAEKTAAAGSSRYSFIGTTHVRGRTIVLEGEGVIDHAGRRGRLVYDTSGFNDFDDVSEGEFGRQLTILFLGPRYYMDFGRDSEIGRSLGPGKRWMMYDLARMGDKAGADLESLPQFENPLEYVAFLRGVTDGAEELGEEDVRGVATTHYRATVDLKRVTDKSADAMRVSEETREGLQREVDRLIAETGLSSIPVEVWLDADGLVRRFVMTIEVGKGSQSVRAESRVELHDFGVRVDVESPASAAVVDVTDLMVEERR